MLARSILPRGVGMSQCCRKRFIRHIVASVDNDNNPTPPKVVCKYLHSVNIFRFTPSPGSARYAKLTVISPICSNVADSVPRPYLRLLQSCSRYEIQACFDGICAFLRLSNQFSAHGSNRSPFISRLPRCSQMMQIVAIWSHIYSQCDSCGICR